ncbi:MAG: hypothetical protein HYU27_02325 [Acidobacteria bacterium]|nr:hypothetical protein [Acidobacteriota bacterium]
MAQRLFRLWLDNNDCLENPAIAFEGVRRLRPVDQIVKNLGDMAVVSKDLPVDRLERVATANSGLVRGALFNNQPGLDAFRALNPGGPVSGRRIPPLLLDVQAAENKDGQSQQ